MLRSMYSGISGLKVNQTKLDVIGNNIANVGTTSFKSQRIRFQDMMSQNLGYAAGPSKNQGGTNPKQIGLGVQIAGIDTIASQGNMQPTGRNLDVAVDGEGYFMVANGPVNYGGDEGTKASAYTRDGSFTLDSDGNLLTSNGDRVLGYTFNGALTGNEEGTNVKPQVGYVNPDEELSDPQLSTLVIPEIVDGRRVTGFVIEPSGLIKATLKGAESADGGADDKKGDITVLGQIAMASFKNPGGLEKLGKNLYRESANSGTAIVKTAIGTEAETDNSGGYGNMMQGALEMSNVDLAEQFTEMIVASRAFQANGKMITTGDEILQDLVNLKR